MLTAIIKSVLVFALLPAPVSLGISEDSQWMIDAVEQVVDFFADQMEPMEDAIEEISMAKKHYPARYFSRKAVIPKANEWGLTDIENEDLTTEGLIAKMMEWQKKYGGVDKYVYDLTAKTLEAKGRKMPKEIRRGQNEG